MTRHEDGSPGGARAVVVHPEQLLPGAPRGGSQQWEAPPPHQTRTAPTGRKGASEAGVQLKCLRERQNQRKVGERKDKGKHKSND